jgi:hypothetical protein
MTHFVLFLDSKLLLNTFCNSFNKRFFFFFVDMRVDSPFIFSVVNVAMNLEDDNNGKGIDALNPSNLQEEFSREFLRYSVVS